MTNQVSLKNDFILRIPWDFSNGRTYNYGAKISLSVDGVLYSNPMMAQAVKIHTWYSETTYPNDRFSPTLPLLKANHNYALITYYVSNPEKSIFIQVDFFDLYGQLIDRVVDVAGEITFQFPKDASSYQVSLINASNEWLDFSQLLIFETTNELTKYYFDLDSRVFLSRKNDGKNNIAFHHYEDQRLMLSTNTGNKVISDPSLNLSYLNEMLVNNDKKGRLKKLLDQIEPNDSDITFVGYYLFDSLLALLIGELKVSSKVKICDEFDDLINKEKKLSSSVVAKILVIKANLCRESRIV